MEASMIESEGINPTNESSSSNTKVQKINDDNVDKKGEAKISIPFYRLFAFADSTDILLMILGSIGAVANGLALPLMTVIFGNLIQSFGGAMNTHDVVHRVSKVSLEYVYLAIGAGLASFYQVSCWMATGERQAARIRNLYLKTILQQEIAFFDKETKAGEVVGRMSGDTVLIQDAMGEKVGMFIQLVSTFLGGYVVAFIRGWLLTLVMLSMIPVVALAGAAVGGAITKMASAGQTAYAEAAVVVEQTIGSIRTVASFTGEERSIERYKKSLQKAYESSVVEGLVSGLGIGAVMLIMFCGYGLGIWYGSKLILNNGYTGGDVINVIFAVLTGSFSLGQASPCLQAFAAGQAAAHKMFETINRKPEIDASDPKGRKPDDIVGDIEFKDVHFSYPTRQEELIFKGFSLCIQHGSTVALVGESGSGKSSVISLIERFYDPQAGEVLIDNINLKEFQLNWIRGKIGLVSQEPVLFASSIRDNIAYGKDGATNEEINAAAKLANASKFINKLPQGLDTLVGEHGTQLSGGQKQRVAIARAILKDPKILLLDEATSALDAKSERTVQEALDRVMANRTTVIVAHRLSAICNADTIAVLHKGTIVEKGSHSDLLTDPNGAYSRLIHLQEINQYTDCSSQFDKFELSPSPDIQRDISTSSRRSPILNNLQESKQEQSNNKIKAQQIDEVSIHRLAGLNKPEIPVLILGTLAAIVNGILFPVFGVLLSSAINTFYQAPDKLKKDSEFWSILFVMFGCISIVILPARAYFFGVAGAKLIRRIRLVTFKKVVHMEVAWFDDPENSNGAIGARLSADAAQVKGLLGDALSLVVQNITTLVAGLVIAFLANWQLATIILALIPVIGLEGYIQVKFLKGFSANAKMMYEEASQIANNAVGNIRTVASFSAEYKVMELYKKKCEGPTRTGIKRGLVSGVGVGSSFFLLFCFFAVSFYAGALLIQDGKTTFGKVFRVFFALSMAAIGISQSSSLAPDFIKAKSATASVFGILDHKCLIDASEDSGMKVGKVNGDIEFMHVSFKYPSRPDVLIFQDLCLSIQAGKTVALVGESGSGKSTVISLLQRFYDPDSGHILIDGIELPKYSVKWLRQQMGLVSQEPTLFNDTIRANIAYGKEDEATEAEIVGAANSANAHKFISGLQQGYDTLVGERGIQLSGGQKQRVAIARAILKEPKILLLDEATSALDAESERAVQDALDQVMANRTTIVIAHRLSTIRGADVIAVVKNGIIIEKGEHHFLLNIKQGVYASLVALHSGNAR